MAPRLPLVLQDARLLLMRLAYQESLSADCGGGAARSNIQLIPYHIQVRYFLHTNFGFVFTLDLSWHSDESIVSDFFPVVSSLAAEFQISYISPDLSCSVMIYRFIHPNAAFRWLLTLRN